MPVIPILFLSPRVPRPLNTGAKIRTHALLDALRHRFPVHYAGFLQPDLEEREARAYLDGCASIRLCPEPAQGLAAKAWLGARTLPDPRPATIAKYWSADLAALAQRLSERHAPLIVHADHLHMASYFDAAPAAVKVLDQHNVESRIMERLADCRKAWPAGPYLRLQARRMRRFEAARLRGADLVLAVSDGDRDEMVSMASAARIEVIPNGVDTDYFDPDRARRCPQPGELVFTGSMNWLPNQDAMQYFVREILPLLDANSPSNPDSAFRTPHSPFPGWRLSIVGQSPPASVRSLAGPGVVVSGSVPDVRPYLAPASVYVVPLRIGGGSRLKILEAFSMGIPVVSTSVGCEGLGVAHEKHLLIADAPQAFARAIERLRDNPGLGHALAAEARRLVLERFTWKAIGGHLVEVYESLREKLARRPDKDRFVRNA